MQCRNACTCSIHGLCGGRGTQRVLIPAGEYLFRLGVLIPAGEYLFRLGSTYFGWGVLIPAGEYLFRAVCTFRY